MSPLVPLATFFADGRLDTTAAFVLALSSLDARSPDARRLLPSTLEQFNAVSHALGYMLGDALYRAHRAGRLDRSAIRALFTTPIDSGPEAFAKWSPSTREPLRRSA